ncbi:hypothetical protein [Epibacterium ulvae]|uniref:hypothetical protein n=1 Tax=Epibacterium ulvae TaxID=1156985 RepID=UPI001BFC069E|nr:hypothetical protein [Epibacterium ulvae]
MEQVIAALNVARTNGEQARLESADLPADISAAYAVAMAQVAEVAGWKIGGANPWSRAVFDNQEVFVGPLKPSEVSLGCATLSLAGLVAPLGEPELMLEIADPQGKTAEERFSRMGLGIEIPASVLPDVLKPELMGQVCDRAGAGHLWISGLIQFDADRLSAPFDAQFTHNGAEPVVATSANVIAGPLGATEEFLMLAQRYAFPVASGQWIATGGLCPAVALQPGDQLRLTAWGEDLRLQFT